MIKFGKYTDKQRWMCLDCKHSTCSPRQRKLRTKKVVQTIVAEYKEIPNKESDGHSN